MPAQIIESSSRPFNRVELDPITLDIIENAMLNARWEMDAVLFRTAMSPGIREQHDEFPMIANLEGKMVVGQFGSFIHGFKEAYDGTIEEGDMFLTTDPYACNGAVSHANDWLLLRPIFKDGRLIAYASMFGHMTDIGGKVPGSLPTDARQIFEEGIRVPPTKIYKDDQLQEDMLELILHNCRLPHWNRSDFNAIVAAIRTAEKRVIEMAERFGDDVYYSALEELLDRNKRAMGKLIHMTVPETKQYFEDFICDDGLGMGPYKIKCAMWREGDTVIFDFDGTDPQSIGSVNFYLNEEMFKMFAGVYMIMVFDPQIMARTSCTPATGAPTASGTSSTRSASAAFRASPSATGPMAIRCGRASPTCPTSSWRATSRCGSTCTKHWPTAEAPACTGAATRCAWATASWSRAKSRSTTTAGSPTLGA